MRKYSSNLSFVDLLFNLLVGFTSLLVIAFLLINPIAEQGKIDPETKILILVKWDDSSKVDIDTWVRGPSGRAVGFKRKDGNYIILERDDLGVNNDFYEVNGITIAVKRNMESVNINALPAGEYVVNVHNYTTGTAFFNGHNEPIPVPVTVEIIQMKPFKVLYTANVELDFRQERTILTFEIDENEKVLDMRNDIYIPLYGDG